MNTSLTKNKRVNPRLLFMFLRLKGLMFKVTQYVFHSFDELRNSSDLFAPAKRMWFYGGELFYKFYNNKEKYGFLPALIKSINNGGEARFIFGPALYVENKEFLAIAMSTPSVKLYKRDYRDIRHFKLLEIRENQVFAIRDDKHDLDVPSKERKSILYAQGYQSGILDLINKFKKVESECTEITKENIFEEFKPSESPSGELQGFITRKDEGTSATLASQEQIEELRDFLTQKLPLLKKPFSLETLTEPLHSSTSSSLATRPTTSAVS